MLMATSLKIGPQSEDGPHRDVVTNVKAQSSTAVAKVLPSCNRKKNTMSHSHIPGRIYSQYNAIQERPRVLLVKMNGDPQEGHIAIEDSYSERLTRLP